MTLKQSLVCRISLFMCESVVSARQVKYCLNNFSDSLKSEKQAIVVP